MNRINRALTILLASLALTGCADRQEQAEPTPIVVEKPDIIKAARRWELPVWSNPCPSAGKTNRANFQAKIDALHGGDKMLKTNLFNGLCRWQLAQSESGNKA